GELGLAAVARQRARRQDRGERRRLLEAAVGVPELVGAGAQHLAVLGRRDRAVVLQVVEPAVESAVADRAELDDLERSESARIGGLQVVGDALAAEQQQRMRLEGVAQLAIGLGAARDVDEPEAADLGAEAGAERNDLHRTLLSSAFQRAAALSSSAGGRPTAPACRSLFRPS